MNSGDAPHIIIVDDMACIVAVFESLLAEAGYTNTATFTDPRDVLSLIKSGVEPPELIVSDFDMPHMNGVQLLDAARELQPSIKGLIVTSDPEAVYSKAYPVMHKDHTLATRIIAEVNAVLAVV